MDAFSGHIEGTVYYTGSGILITFGDSHLTWAEAQECMGRYEGTLGGIVYISWCRKSFCYYGEVILYTDMQQLFKTVIALNPVMCMWMRGAVPCSGFLPCFGDASPNQ